MDGSSLRFLNPIFLNLLVVPALILFLWLARLVIRRFNVKSYSFGRTVPLKEKYLFAGPMLFWLCIIASIACLIVAIARPQKVISVVNKSSIDLVIIQDGSASMYVKDVKPDRWGRSIAWTRTLVETLAWKGDRIALAVFAYNASPMIRLTSDPNVVMFFLDHLKRSPFRLEDDTAWDTNIEEGVYWGAKILLKDIQLNGPNKNPRAFVVISDGQVWSGRMEQVFKIIKGVGPVYVIGVGTSAGGNIPTAGLHEPAAYGSDGNGNTIVIRPERNYPTIHSSIDRQSLRNIALTGGGEYFELDNQPDVDIAARIINAVQKLKTSESKETSWQDLYWYFILASGIFLTAGVYKLYAR